MLSLSGPDSVGLPAPVVDIKILDSVSRAEIKAGEVGEIAIRGCVFCLSLSASTDALERPNICKGYYKDPEANKKAFTADRFYCTGDLGRVAPDGFLYIVDRGQ